MRDVDEALAAVATAIGVPRVEPNGDGWVELRVRGRALYLQVLREEGEIEVSARVPSFGAQPRTEVLEGMLRWNMTHAPLRLSLEPGGGGVLLGRRIEASLLDAAGMRQAVGEVAVEAARLDEAGPRSLPPAQRRAASQAVGEEIMLRL